MTQFQQIDIFIHDIDYSVQIQERWLDIDEYLNIEATPITQDLLNHESSNIAQETITSEEVSFIPLELSTLTEQIHEGNSVQSGGQSQQISIPIVTKRIAHSVTTKNVCIYICQKTIKVIQEDIYSSKLFEICQRYGMKKQDFVARIIKQRKFLTGPKALQAYIQTQTTESEIFREFMKWFLKQKYIRHCLAGDMSNKEAYLRYKNEVILMILR